MRMEIDVVTDLCNRVLHKFTASLFSLHKGLSSGVRHGWRKKEQLVQALGFVGLAHKRDSEALVFLISPQTTGGLKGNIPAGS